MEGKVAGELAEVGRRFAPLAGLVVALLGNPYAATLAPKLPAVLLTYEVSDVAERAAARAILGESEVRGRLPIELPGLYPVGHGLERSGTPASR
jgi:beta-N-acetylhexosaminidase